MKYITLLYDFSTNCYFPGKYITKSSLNAPDKTTYARCFFIKELHRRKLFHIDLEH